MSLLHLVCLYGFQLPGCRCSVSSSAALLHPPPDTRLDLRRSGSAESPCMGGVPQCRYHVRCDAPGPCELRQVASAVATKSHADAAY